jgi:putative acetyltransferase
VVADAEDRAVGFMGLTGSNIDALFVDPELHGRGIGRALVEHARSVAGDELTVDVNEQNESGAGFYERLGFRRIGRSELDEQGRPYPLLHLRLEA